MWKKSVAVRALVVALLAAPQAGGASELEAAIEAGAAEFVKRFAAGDSAALAELYTENAQLLPPNADIVSGRPAIAAFWQGAMDAGIENVDLEILEILGMDEMACEVGRYTLSSGEGEVVDHGKYIVIWRRGPGGWRLHRDIWNSSQAMPAPTDDA